MRQDLPCFIYAHSMGSMVTNSFLINNPEVAKKIAGVIFSAPFFAFAPGTVNAGKKLAVKVIEDIFGDFVINSGLPLQYITQNKRFIAKKFKESKSNPFISASLISSMMR